MMQIAHVKIKRRQPSKPGDNALATCSLTIEGQDWIGGQYVELSFVVHEIRVIQRKDGRGVFVAMPSRNGPGGEWQDIVHPSDRATRAWIEEAVLDKWKELQT